jgi:hypothetical protein
LGLLASLAIWTGAAHAAGAERASRSALIIAIANYGPPQIPALDGVPFDVDSARTIARAMGIPDQRITVLRDAQATKAGILRALDTLGQSVTEGGRVLVYFSGHGTRWMEKNTGCKEGLLAYDGQTMTNDEIAQRTRRMSEVADKVIVMFDACHSEGVSTRRAARAGSDARASAASTPDTRSAKETTGAASGFTHVRHSTTTHQIDLVDETHANGRLYFFVVTDIGLDHWGRYVDSYVSLNGQWK